MKNVNLRKIGAIVAGATILASSVAFAGGLMYGDTQLTNDDGQPLVKIVVGENAAASDGVAAAYIAGKIANEAYKSTTLTAEVVGEATCDVGEGEEGETAGTCSVVEGSEKVNLQITVPGAGIGGVHTFEAAIGDYIDRELKTRNTTDDLLDDDEGYIVIDEYDDEDANPFQTTAGGPPNNAGFLEGFAADEGENIAMYKIGAGEFTPFAAKMVMDSTAGNEWEEEQAVWFNGENEWVESDDELQSNIEFAAYTIIFDPSGDYGLPLCPGDEGTPLETAAAGGAVCDDIDSLPAHKVYLSFLGEDWVISEVEDIEGTGPATGVDGETYRLDGAIIKLAKEAVSGILNVGDELDAGTGYKVRLDDISRETGVGNVHPAIISVIDASGNVVCQDQVNPGDTRDDLCSVSTGIKLHVYQTAPGLNFIAKWADLAIYSDEIELEDGETFLDDEGEDSDWEVVLGFSQKGDWDSGVAGEGSEEAEYLRTIMLFNDDGEDELEDGDSFGITDVEGYTPWSLTYDGIDDSDTEYDSLQYKFKDSKKFTVRNETGNTCVVEADWVEVTTSKGEFKISAPFYSDGDGMKKGTKMWVLYDDTTSTGDTTCPGLDAAGNGTVVIETDDSGDDKYWFYAADDPLVVDYKWAGPEGHLLVYDNSVYNGGAGVEYIDLTLVGNAGEYKNPTDFDVVDALSTSVVDDNGIKLYTVDDDDEDKVLLNMAEEAVSEDARDDTMFYKIGNYEDDNEYEEGFISPRGTEFVDGAESSRKFSVPKNLLYTGYTFATSDSEDADPDTSTYLKGEGDEWAVGTTGVTIKVLEITEQLTPCTIGEAGEAPLCTPNMGAVSAVIMPENTPSVEASVPYKLTSNLVVLDSDATALDSGVVVTVGGDVANTVTADAIEGAEVDFTATPVVVKAIGNKIVVAGLNAEDTLAAAEQFVGELQRA